VSSLSTYVQDDLVEEGHGVAKEETWHDVPVDPSSQAFEINFVRSLGTLLDTRQEIVGFVGVFRYDHGPFDLWMRSAHDSSSLAVLFSSSGIADDRIFEDTETS